MKILVCSHKKFDIINNTDIRQVIFYKEFEKYIDGVEVQYLTSTTSLILQKLQYYINRISKKLSKHGFRSNFLEYLLTRYYIISNEIKLSKPDIIISYVLCPILPKKYYKIPIFHTGGLMTFDYVKSIYGVTNTHKYMDMQLQRESQIIKTIKCCHSHTKASKLISIENFPEYNHKFFYAPFFLPNLSKISDSEYEKKWMDPITKVVFIGNAAKRKGLAFLLDSWVRLNCCNNNQIELTIISNFTDGHVKTPSAKNIYIKSGISNVEVNKILRESHILVLPSIIESYGIVYVEAMAAGCAIIGPNTEVQREIIIESASGIVCNPSDAAEFDLKLNIMFNRLLAKKYSENGLHYYNENFSDKLVCNLYYSKWKELIAESKSELLHV